MKKVPYYHSKHQQLWTYLSNPHIVNEWIDKPKKVIMSKDRISTLKEYVLYTYVKERGDGIYSGINCYCFPCDAAARAIKLNRTYLVHYKCDVCPLSGLNCMNDDSIYDQANDCLSTILVTIDDTKRKEKLFEFCSLAQKIAFFPLCDKNIIKMLYNVV